MAFYLCIDCGGSKTIAVIADADGATLSRARGGPSNFAYLGLIPFVAVVQETVQAALQALPPALDAPRTLPPSAAIFAAVWMGVSGVDSPAAIAAITPPLTSLFGVQPLVANDTHLLAAPLKLYPDVSSAIGAVAGTGGIVVSFREVPAGAVDAVGLQELGRVGGWGWILGDEGGGFHVGREAVRQILADADRASVHRPLDAPPGPAPPHGLAQRICARYGVQDVFELLTVVHLPDPDTDIGADGAEPHYAQMAREKRLSSLAPLVFAAAFEDRDPVALRVLRATSGALADQICVLLRPAQPAPDAGAGAGSWMHTGWMDVRPPTPAAAADGPAPRTVPADASILCLGGSLAGVEAYRALVLEELFRRGHVFARVEVIVDAAEVGARALASAAKGR
ncbi:hypothetical protein B0H21DRAFT_780089 [Amylocystis lapponica]|nr:hypothetical protein B0H21DRAFT_780089 [Amylocystis lapponica]